MRQVLAFPKQGRAVGKKVILRDWRTSGRVCGKYIRYDLSYPFQKILRLEIGRVLFNSQCDSFTVEEIYYEN